MKIFIIYNISKDLDGKNLNKLTSFLNDEKVEYEINSNYEVILNDEENKLYKYDLIITLGGDGTVIHGCKYALKYNIPVIGINAGHLGFLTQIDIKNIDKLKDLFSGNYIVNERTVVEAAINNDDKKYYAINDVVVDRGEAIRLVDIDLYCNLEKVSSYRADGLIVSTPVGSTAYSLAAGGPIVDLSLKGMVLTPISSHSLKSRPIVFGAKKELKIISRSNHILKVAVDGNVIKEIKKDEFVNVKISDKKYKFISFNKRSDLKIFDSPI